MSSELTKRLFKRHHSRKLPPLTPLSELLPRGILLHMPPVFPKSHKNLSPDHTKDLKDMETNTDFEPIESSIQIPRVRPKILSKSFSKSPKPAFSSCKQLTPVSFFPEFLSSKPIAVRKKSQGYLRKPINSTDYSPARKSSSVAKNVLRMKMFKFL